MNTQVRQAFDTEMKVAKEFFAKGDLEKSFKHLERAHVLGQLYVVPHVKSHWWMLKVGFCRASVQEILGQTVRIIFGALGSAVGIVPVGNTGGTNISMFARLPIQPDIAKILNKI